MELPENISYNALERYSYRDLQQLAKKMELPSNVKKMYLIEMILAKKHSSPADLNAIVSRIREERKKISKHRKQYVRKKKGVQGMEISSTSNPSPPITTTPQRNFAQYHQNPNPTVMRYNTSILNPLITKQALNSDRVLRSYNNRSRRKYSILNMNNSVVGVIKAQNTVQSSEEVQERRFEWDNALKSYRPVEAILHRRQTIEADEYFLPQPRPCTSTRPKEESPQDKQLVSVARSSNIASKPRSRGRRLSGIYPLKPFDQLQCQVALTPIVSCRRQDGRISKLNSIVQRPEQNMPLNVYRNKMTQTTVRKNIKPVIVSLKNVIQNPRHAIMQKFGSHIERGLNVLNQRAKPSGSDDMIKRAEFQKTVYIETQNSGLNLLKQRNRSSSDVQKPFERQNINYIVKSGNSSKTYGSQIAKSATKSQDYVVKIKKSSEIKSYDMQMPSITIESVDTDNNEEYIDHNRAVVRTYGTHNANRDYEDKDYSIQNARRFSNTNQDMHSCNMYQTEPEKTYFQRGNLSDNQTKFPYDKTYTEVYNQYIKNSESGTLSKRNDNAARNCNKMKSTTNYYAPIGNSRNIENLNNSFMNATANISMETNANAARDYPNMSALTEMYPEEMYSTHTNVNSDTTDYYHKKIRAEQVRIHRSSLSQSHCPQQGNLPHITDVFSQFRDNSAYNTGEDTEPANNTPLESIYNYRGTSLVQPLNVHHEIRTTTNTQLVYSTPIMATSREMDRRPVEDRWISLDAGGNGPVALEIDWRGLCSAVDRYNYIPSELGQPSMSHDLATMSNSMQVHSVPIMATGVSNASTTDLSLYRTDLLPRVSQQYNIEAESIPRLQDYLRMDELRQRDVKCDGVMQLSPGSSTTTGSLADVTDVLSSGTAEMEDALDLISQDGDYMERIGMDVRTQCLVCDWAGPRTILEYHVRMEHASVMVHRSSSQWCESVNIAAARHGAGVTSLSHHGARVYALRATATHYLRARCVMLPKDDDTETEERIKSGRLTVYNKVTGEPYIWEGEISTLPETNDFNGLNVDLASLDLLPNSANLKLVNGEWVSNSSVKVVAGQPELNNIDIVVHVEIFD